VRGVPPPFPGRIGNAHLRAGNALESFDKVRLSADDPELCPADLLIREEVESPNQMRHGRSIAYICEGGGGIVERITILRPSWSVRAIIEDLMQMG